MTSPKYNNKLCHTCLETDMEVDTDTINSQKTGKSLRKLLLTMFICIVVPAILFMGMIIAIVPRGC